MSIQTVLAALLCAVVAWGAWTLASNFVESIPTDQERIAKVKALARSACGDEYTFKYSSGYMAFSCNTAEGK